MILHWLVGIWEKTLQIVSRDQKMTISLPIEVWLATVGLQPQSQRAKVKSLVVVEPVDLVRASVLGPG